MRSDSLLKERLGIITQNTFGSEMQVVEYRGAGDITVKFLKHGNTTTCIWRNFIAGKVRNVYDKSVCGVGFIGEGKYKPKDLNRNRDSDQYKIWHGMLHRCYDERVHLKLPTYRDCTVDEKWHNFQNFAKWYDENFYKIEGERTSLDKDILIKGNKVYSPDTCLFVPQRINSLFVKNNARRGNLPVGVHFHEKTKKYVASYQIGTTTIRIGGYSNMYDAFEAYKIHKEGLIKDIAYEYKEKIPLNVFNALLNYKVEFSD